MNISFYLIPKQEVCYISEEETLIEGLQTMKKRGYQAVPVINKEGAYCGTVTEGDFLRALTDEDPMTMKEMHRKTVKDLKKKWHYDPVNIDARINELEDKIIDQNFVPVVDGRGIFIGIVTRKVILINLIAKIEKELNEN